MTLADLIHRVDERSPSERPLDRLELAVTVANQLDLLADGLVGHFVDRAKADGSSWAQVGAVLGVSKQAAQQRFVPTDPDLTRWTDRAKKALDHAHQEAVRLGQAFVGTEHLLLGILRGDNLATVALAELAVDVAELSRLLEGSTRPRPTVKAKELPYTPLARQALERTLREALRLGHNYVGTEHVLIALAAGEGGAAEALTATGVTPDSARRQIIKLLAAYR